ncbi:MAG: hypothetical protein WAL22_17805 [Solirubrobacteraceae bacterium]
MKLPHKKSPLDRVIEVAEDSVDGSNSITQTISKLDLTKHVKAAVPDGARTVGLIAGGMAGLTAGSVGISSYRRRKAGASDHS